MIHNKVSRAPGPVRIKRVLISVYDKTGLEELVTGMLLQVPELMIYSTGGTFKACEAILGPQSAHHLSQVSDYTGQKEMHGGLVKTLDFKIYLGLLSEPYNPLHDQDLAAAGAIPFDMVVANLYPFSETVSTAGTDCENARANIDIGGPCMIRASAKNYLRVASVCRPSDYGAILSEMRELQGCLSMPTRFTLAQKAFAHTAAYDAEVSSYLAKQSAENLSDLYTIIPNQGEAHV